MNNHTLLVSTHAVEQPEPWIPGSNPGVVLFASAFIILCSLASVCTSSHIGDLEIVHFTLQSWDFERYQKFSTLLKSDFPSH